ncbi:MAG: DnaJ domain-containing protein [Lachnospiraceae bacterium]|nr:DnaJ domain-containing protein [Lachnospiraceae bacterium]
MEYYWALLGIKPTCDVKAIKKAYAKKAKEFHPSEHPEEYERIKSAYQMALADAKRESSKPPEAEEIPSFEEPVEEKHLPEAETAQQLNFHTGRFQQDHYWEEELKDRSNDFQTLHFDVEAGGSLEENENSFQKILEDIRKDKNLNWCQIHFMELFFQQVISFHADRIAHSVYWKALCERVKTDYLKERSQYPDSKGSLFFPNPHVTEHLLRVLPMFQELDYRTWDVLEGYLLPRKTERSKPEWQPVVDHFRRVRAYQLPGQQYAKEKYVSPAEAKRRIFTWRTSTKKDNSRTWRVGAWTVAIMIALMVFTSTLQDAHKHRNEPHQQVNPTVNQYIEEYNQQWLDTQQQDQIPVLNVYTYDGKPYIITDTEDVYLLPVNTDGENGSIGEGISEEDFLAEHPDAEESLHKKLEELRLQKQRSAP